MTLSDPQDKAEEIEIVPAPGSFSAADKCSHMVQLVLDSMTSPHSKRAYRNGSGRKLWLSAGAALPLVPRRAGQPLRLIVLSRPFVSYRKKLALPGLLPAATANAVRAVKGVKRLDVRAGNWLGREQAEQLLALPDRSTLVGKRDRVLLSLLLGGGLRREEIATLTIAHVQQRENRSTRHERFGRRIWDRMRSFSTGAYGRTQRAIVEWSSCKLRYSIITIAERVTKIPAQSTAG